MATNRDKVGTSQPGLMSSSPFLGGLNTELSGIVDSTEFTKDECNVMIRADGSRSRRPGVDYEEQFKFTTEVIDNLDNYTAFNSIEWYDINSPDESVTYNQTPYIVVQLGSKLIFYRNHGEPYSQDQADFTLDLNNYKLDTDPTDPAYRDPAKYRCKFAVAYGCLFITSKAIQTIRLRSAQEEIPFDPLDPTTFPECQVSCAAYKGKHQRLCAPSLHNGNKEAYVRILFNDAVVLSYKVQRDPDEWRVIPNSYTIAEAFNNLSAVTRRGITATPFENAPDQWTNPSLGTYSWSPADWITFTGSTSTVRGLKITIHVSGWVYRSGNWHFKENYYTGYMSGGQSTYENAHPFSLTIRDDFVGATDYLNIETNPPVLSYAHLYNLLNQGWTTKLIADFFIKSGDNNAARFFPGNNLAQQYLKDKKTDAFKPEALVNMTFGNTPAARGHFKLDYFDQQRNFTADLDAKMLEILNYIQVTEPSTTLDDILDLDFPVDDPYDSALEVPDVKPKVDFVADVLPYAGRMFYLSGSTLLYSQMISEDVSRADKCYTDADPTSEEISDVVETDGGLISLPELGEGIKLAQVGDYILAFGTRSNMAITGTANNIFTATAYSAGALNAVPTQSPDSFVNTEFGLFYWGTTGITLITPAEGGLSVQDLSTSRILTFFGKLSNTQHKYCKGVYSSSKKKVYWFYPSNDERPRRLDMVLLFDIPHQAFITYKIASTTVDEESGDILEGTTPEIVSGLPLKVPFKDTKEYPVTVEVANCIEEDGWIKTAERVNLAINTGIAFKLDGSYLVDAEVGDEIELLRINDVVVSSITKTGENAVLFRILDWSTSASITAPITWFGLVPVNPNHYAIVICGTQSIESLSDVPLDDWALVSLRAYTGLDDNAFIAYSARCYTEGCFGYGEFLNTTEFTEWSFVANAITTGYEVLDDDGIKILADDPIDSEVFTYESSILVCLDIANVKITFGDFRNNLLLDWTAGDWNGPGYVFDSYLISHPMNSTSTSAFTGRRITDLVHTKNMPYLVTYFRRTETGNTVDGGYVYPSQCQGSILWDWRTSGRAGKWSSPTDLYRPRKSTIFDNGYIINKTNIRGLGRAYQVKLESVGEKQFILEGLVYDLKNDGRI